MSEFKFPTDNKPIPKTILHYPPDNYPPEYDEHRTMPIGLAKVDDGCVFKFVQEDTSLAVVGHFLAFISGAIVGAFVTLVVMS